MGPPLTARAEMAATGGMTAAGPEPRALWATPSPSEPNPDVAHDLPRYRTWVAARQDERLAARGPGQESTATGPELALLLALGRVDPDGLRRCLASVAAQTTDRWRLSVVLPGDLDPDADAALGEALGTLPARRTDVRRAPEGATAADAAQLALETTSAPAFAILGPDDQLAPDAVALLSAALVDADVAYADDDRVDAEGAAFDPRLKPDWSPELALGWDYVGHPVAYRRAPTETAGGIEPLADGDWEHDLLLRVTEVTDRVAHVAEVLCHRRSDHAGEPADTGGTVHAALVRRGKGDARVEPGPLAGSWRVLRPVTGRHKVSAVVPFRDSTTLLRTCVESLLATTGGIELELLLVDNGSAEPETLTLLERFEASSPAVRVHRDPRPFNWAALNNAAADLAGGDLLLFVNDDVEARAAGWLDAMVAQAMRPEVAAVGARLLYPSGRVQSAGTVVRLGGAAGHVLTGLPGDQPGYLGMAVLARDVTAVTGACMAVRRELFDRLGRFDEGLGVDCNDVDFCLRARAAGYRVLYEPAAELVHRESPSRGLSGSNADIARFVDRWEETLLAGDPFLNPHLTRADLSPGLAQSHELAQWWEWRSRLADP